MKRKTQHRDVRIKMFSDDDFFFSFPAGVSSSQTLDCSYLGLLSHLNLMTTNEVLSIMRPVKNWTSSTLVELDMLMYGILGVDEKTQTVTSHIWLQMVRVWTDTFTGSLNVTHSPTCVIIMSEHTFLFSQRWKNEFLTWNPSDFCEIYMLTVPRSKLWIPDVNIREDASDTGSVQQSPLVSLYPSGFVYANGRKRLTFTCQLRLFKFPFDTQNCNITFSSANYDGKSFFTSRICHGAYLSEARGEKLGFKVTVLLSISVLLLILQDMLPSTEDTLPMIANYCVGVFALVGISVLEAMLICFLMDLDDYLNKKVEKSVNTQVEIQLETSCHKEPAGAEGRGQVSPVKSHLPADCPRDHDLLRLILEEVKAARQEAGRKDEKKKKPGRYERLALIIDPVFFALYLLTIIVFLVFIYHGWV
uniref:5-hydroxytryptamine receptor 3A-like n=1 Tax=Lates calcarifer TaxID=8187 RepID=A0A4W6DV12_LATCA